MSLAFSRSALALLLFVILFSTAEARVYTFDFSNSGTTDLIDLAAGAEYYTASDGVHIYKIFRYDQGAQSYKLIDGAGIRLGRKATNDAIVGINFNDTGIADSAMVQKMEVYVTEFTSVAQNSIVVPSGSSSKIIQNTALTIGWVNTSITEWNFGTYKAKYATGTVNGAIQLYGGGQNGANTTFKYLRITTNESGDSPGGGNSSSGQIRFDAANFNIGNSYGVIVGLTSANYSEFNAYYIDVFKPGGTLVDGFPVQFDTQTYNTGRLWTFDKTGAWYANLSYCSYINLLCPSVIAPTLIDTAYLTISPVSYTYNLTTDKANYQNGDTISITATNPSLNNVYVTVRGPGDGNQAIWADIADNVLVQPNTIQVINGTITSDMPRGQYFVTMATSPLSGGLVARTVYNITMPSSTSNTLGLSWDSAFYAIGGSGLLRYVSNYNISYVEIFNTDLNLNITSVRNVTVNPNSTGNISQSMNTMGLWYASIKDQNTTSNIVWANITVLAAVPDFDPDYVKDCLSTQNYACWDKTEYIQGSAFVINYKVTLPTVITYDAILNIYDPDGQRVKTVNLEREYFSNIISGSYAGTFSKSAKTGLWNAKLEKNNTVTGDYVGDIANSVANVVRANATASTTAIPSGSGAVSSVGNNLLVLVNQMFFWGLVFLLLFAITVYRGNFIDTHRGAAVLGFAFLETIGGLFAPYTLTVFAVLVILIALSFRKGQDAVTGG